METGIASGIAYGKAHPITNELREALTWIMTIFEQAEARMGTVTHEDIPGELASTLRRLFALSLDVERIERELAEANGRTAQTETMPPANAETHVLGNDASSLGGRSTLVSLVELDSALTLAKDARRRLRSLVGAGMLMPDDLSPGPRKGSVRRFSRLAAGMESALDALVGELQQAWPHHDASPASTRRAVSEASDDAA